jgi:ribonuclease HI
MKTKQAESNRKKKFTSADASGKKPKKKIPKARTEKQLKEVTIICDGSSLGNGKENPRAAAVALLGFKGIWKAFGIVLGNATNQQAEVAAATLGLESLREKCRVHLMTDSRYVVETMTGNFKRKANHEWWEKLDEAAARHVVTWEWTKGHAGHEIQEIADKVARKIAERGRIDRELLEDAVVDIGVKEI